jgi:NTE family protein
MNMKSILAILCTVAAAWLLWPTVPLLAAEQQRPKIGLVLSGGGARGAAHIGVIRELERLRIPIDYVAGTSMGAIIGGLYATGMNAEQLEQTLNAIDWGDVFNDRPPRTQISVRRKQEEALFLLDKESGFKDGKIRFPRGFVGGQKLYLVLKQYTLSAGVINDFDNLSIPFRAMASDLATGEAVALGSGDLANALRASMAVPAFIAPVEIGGRLLVDGGIASNLPIDVVREMGADIVIAVDISTPLNSKEDLESLASIVDQLTGLLTRRNVEIQLQSLSQDDVLITPELGDIGASDFKRVQEAVEAGTKAAVDLSPRLARLSVAETEYAEHPHSGSGETAQPPIVHFIRIENDSEIAEEVIRSHMTIKLGEPLDIKTLETDIGSLYGLGVFESVRYDIAQEQGQSGVVVSLKEKPWGPNYLQFGLRFSTNFANDNRLDLRLGFLHTPANRFGAEWRTVLGFGEEPRLVTELYQPLGLGSAYFVLPRVSFTADRFNLREGEQITSENRVREYGVSLALGREFGVWGQATVGLSRSRGDVDTRIGVPSVPQGSFDNGEGFVRLIIDTLDDINFPTSGQYSDTRWLLSEPSLGADDDFQQFMLNVGAARSWGRNTFHGSAKYFTTYVGEAPLQSQFRAGGLFNLPGFTEDELSGQHYVLLRLGYMRRLGDYLALPVFAGGTLQRGNVFEDEDDIDFDNLLTAGSIFIGVKSIVGPVYFGYGFAEGGNDNISFLVGRGF